MKELMAITDNYRSKPSRRNDFVPQGDGTVVDKRTGLQWMRCGVGQSWTGTTCSGEPDKYKWEQAKAVSDSFAGHSDWRLPTRFELETLVYCSSGKDTGRYGEAKLFDLSWCDGNYQKPTIVQKAFPNTGGSGKHPFYWSSSPDADSSYYAWSVYFGNGGAYDDGKDNSRYVRLVRGGQ